MKKAFILAALLASSPAFSQSSADGNIVFQNINIAVSPGSTVGGSNGNGTYNVPIYVHQPGGTVQGGGLLPGGMTAGLFLPNQTTPLATAILGTTPTTAPYIATPFSQPVFVTGSPAGSTPILTVRVWQDTTKSFGQAVAAGLVWGEWTFTAPPLGGTPFNGNPIQVPTMSGWGPLDGSGFTLVPEPSIVVLTTVGIGAVMLRRFYQSKTELSHSTDLKCDLNNRLRLGLLFLDATNFWVANAPNHENGVYSRGAAGVQPRVLAKLDRRQYHPSKL